MKLVWCPETAARAYIDAVKALAEQEVGETEVAEMVSAMAGGWKAQLIVDAGTCGDCAATSVGLQAAARYTGGRHICVVPEGQSLMEYREVMRRAGLESAVAATPVMAGEAEEVMRELEGVDFVVVDWRRRDAAKVLRAARAGPGGMVVVCRSAGRWRGSAAAVVKGAGMRVVRSALLPIEWGVEVLYVGVGKGPSLDGSRSRWIRHVDQDGEEHLFRR
ncbi:uncharacterized protein LOC103713408 [Phoenix dactylifera]|uniref:Uncharacterized protein LOC103713408 n=1 Tax=Phoenix dactylifera TaxID=42345 RepID=A0A8B7CG05_PHODC|nr:uncharacterized protein LOC103713408 [Phoenix dactylifera]